MKKVILPVTVLCMLLLNSCGSSSMEEEAFAKSCELVKLMVEDKYSNDKNSKEINEKIEKKQKEIEDLGKKIMEKKEKMSEKDREAYEKKWRTKAKDYEEKCNKEAEELEKELEGKRKG